MAIICPICGAENPDSAEYCSLCLASMGFNSADMAVPVPKDDGYRTHYPSSFDESDSETEESANWGEAPPEAPPVDVGEYGVATGHQVEGEGEEAPPPPPEDWGEIEEPIPPQQEITEPESDASVSYDWPTAEFAEDETLNASHGILHTEFPENQTIVPQGNVLGGYPDIESSMAHGGSAAAVYPGRVARHVSSAHPFGWGKAVLRCAEIAMVAAAISVVLELLFSFVGYSIVVSGNVTRGLFVILMALLIPVVFAGFASGYRLEGYGWAVGLVAVAIWAFVFRPLYFAVFSWLLTDRFTFASLFNTYSLVFICGLFLPIGTFMGWIGEKRATTGLYF